MGGDEAMRQFGAGVPTPEFRNAAWSGPRDVRQSRVAIVTSAALYPATGRAFDRVDGSYRILDRTDRQLVLGHWSTNFDRSAFAIDPNVVIPLDRLEELATDGVIGDVAPRHISFAGNQPDELAVVRHDTGPAAASDLRADDVDVAIFTPV